MVGAAIATASLGVPATPLAHAASPAACTPSVKHFPYDLNGLSTGGIQFSSLSTGWAVHAGRVLRTTSAGGSWSVVYRHEAAGFAQVDAVDDEHVWAVGRRIVISTSDGGRTWHQLAPGLCPTISAVSFFSATRGVAVAGRSLLRTTDGGWHWQAVNAPARVQSACFTDAAHGWLGAHGRVYRTSDGGEHWRLSVAGPRERKAQRRLTAAFVECAGARSGWAEVVVGAAASNQQPHLGYHLAAAGSRPAFEESYFRYRGVPDVPSSPGGYYGAFSSVDSSRAVYVDNCPPCGYGMPQLAVVTQRGGKVGRAVRVRHLNDADSAAFLSTSIGWVTGRAALKATPSRWRIVHTVDGGKSWTTQYQS